jgi:hypothetical protein
MAKLKDISGGNWINREYLEEGKKTVTLTIASVIDGELPDGKAQRVLTFENCDERFGLNVTNWMEIAEISDQDPKTADDDEFVGVTIEIYFDPKIKMGAKTVGGVRVRKPSGKAATRPAAPAPSDDGPPDDDAAPDDATKGMTKDEAWREFSRDFKAANTDATAASTAAAWKTAVAEHAKEKGIEQAKFTPEDWAVIAGSGGIPF